MALEARARPQIPEAELPLRAALQERAGPQALTAGQQSPRLTTLPRVAAREMSKGQQWRRPCGEPEARSGLLRGSRRFFVFPNV